MNEKLLRAVAAVFAAAAVGALPVLVPHGGPAAARGADAPAVTDDKADEKPAEEAKLPGGTWDTRDLDKNWTVVRRKYDPTRNEVTWVLEAKRDIDAQNHRMGLDVTYYDEDDVRVEVSPLLGGLNFEPPYGFKKGDRARATLALPKDEQMQKVKKVVVKSER